MKDSVAFHGIQNAPKARWFHKRRLRKIAKLNTPAVAVYARVPLFVRVNMGFGLFPLVLAIHHRGGKEQVSITEPNPWDSLTMIPVSEGTCNVHLRAGQRSTEIERVLQGDEVLLIYARATFGFRSKKSYVHNVYCGIVDASYLE